MSDIRGFKNVYNFWSINPIIESTSRYQLFAIFSISSDGSNYVRSLMFNDLKPKTGCSSSITNSSFVQCSKKNDIWASSVSNLVNLVKALCWEFDRSKPKIGGVLVQSSIYEHVRVRSMFEKWCSSSFNVPWNGVLPITIPFLLHFLKIQDFCTEITWKQPILTCSMWFHEIFLNESNCHFPHCAQLSS